MDANARKRMTVKTQRSPIDEPAKARSFCIVKIECFREKRRRERRKERERRRVAQRGAEAPLRPQT